MHFGRYAGMYLRKTFYFDIHPPLGKLLFAAAGAYGGFDPEFKFEKIGAGTPLPHVRNYFYSEIMYLFLDVTEGVTFQK